MEEGAYWSVGCPDDTHVCETNAIDRSSIRCLNTTYRGILAVILSRTEDGVSRRDTTILRVTIARAFFRWHTQQHGDSRTFARAYSSQAYGCARRRVAIEPRIKLRYRSRPTDLAGRTTLARANANATRTNVSDERTFSTNERFPFVFLDR